MLIKKNVKETIEPNKVKYYVYVRRINGVCRSKVLVDCIPGGKGKNGTQKMNLKNTIQEFLRQNKKCDYFRLEIVAKKPEKNIFSSGKNPLFCRNTQGRMIV